jgi:hypothetical protein
MGASVLGPPARWHQGVPPLAVAAAVDGAPPTDGVTHALGLSVVVAHSAGRSLWTKSTVGT